MQKRLVTQYTAKPEEADDNQRRIEAVFVTLSNSKPANVSYIVLRLSDDSFVHVSFHNHGDDEPNPIADSPAFARFQDGHEHRRQGGVNQKQATLVGAYITEIA